MIYIFPTYSKFKGKHVISHKAQITSFKDYQTVSKIKGVYCFSDDINIKYPPLFCISKEIGFDKNIKLLVYISLLGWYIKNKKKGQDRNGIVYEQSL